MTRPYLFDEFFSSGMEESISPFLEKSSRKWGKNLPLKSAIIAAVLLALSFALSFYSIHVSYLILTFVYFLVGIPAIIDTFEDFKNLEINIDVLMTLAAFISIAIGSGFEGALLLVLFELSGAMEHAVTSKARGALHTLHHLAPKKAFLVEDDGTIIERSVNDIRIGTKILVKAGEVVPLDGKVIEGTSSVNLVHLTGESLPVRKEKGMEVPAGANNLDAALTIEVTRTSSDSTLAKIIELITKAQGAKPKLQRVLDRFGKRYATTIIFLTFAFAFLLPFIFSIPYLGEEGAIYRALTFMIAASPCALIIATPTAYLSSISACAKNGVLLKGGITLDALSRCHTVSFDKTGTLTTGKLSILSFRPLTENPENEEEALSIAYGLERHVIHPISSAITEFAQSKNLSPQEILDFQSLPGFGLQGMIEKEGAKIPVAIGLPEFIASMVQKKDLIPERKEGELLTLLLIGTSLYVFELQDSPREKIGEMMDSIRGAGLKTLMLTGDHKPNAERVAKEFGIDDFYADLRPEDKLNLVEKHSQEEGLAMVGDGVNDAPALARSTVGISMGKIGSMAAIDASDVVLLNDEIHVLGWLFKKAHKTMRIVKQNLTLALGVIIFATTPALLGFIPLWLAVILHEGGTVLVGLNSLRLLKK